MRRCRNIFAVTTAGTLSGTTPPTATTGPQTNGSATLYLSGTAATAIANWDATTQKVRSITVTSPGNGYHANVAVEFTGVTPTTAAAATCIVLQNIQGPQFGVSYDRNGGTTITGAVNVNNSQNIAGIAILNTAQTNLNYASAPTVGFGLPVRTFLTTAKGSGYTTATVTFTYPSGTVTTAATGTATVVNGKVTSFADRKSVV